MPNNYLLVDGLILLLMLIVEAPFRFSMVGVQLFVNVWEMTAKSIPIGVLKSGMGQGVRREEEAFKEIFRHLHFLRKESQRADSNTFSLSQNTFALILLLSVFA